MAVDPVDVEVHTRATTAVTDAEAICRFRLTVLEHAATSGNVTATCARIRGRSRPAGSTPLWADSSVKYGRPPGLVRLDIEGAAMSNPRVQHQVRQVESRRDGIRDNLRAHEREIVQLERDLRDAGGHTDAYLRQQDIQRRISSVQGSIRSAERELARSERELQNLRSMAS